MSKTYYPSPVPALDDFEHPIVDEFIDGKTVYGPWARMTPESFALHGNGKLGQGFGQRYKIQPPSSVEDGGKWLKVEG